MQLVVKGKNMEIAERLRKFVESKVPSRLSRILPQDAEVEVEINSSKSKSSEIRYVAQMTVKMNGALIRGEQAAPDSYSAVDAVIDRIERQILRFKSKRYGPYNRAWVKSLPPEEELEPEEAPEEDEEPFEGRLVRTKHFALKPMSVDEALMQMQMLGHDFFVFYNGEVHAVNVVYKRKDGNFGLIEPDVE